jgi:hypothetical protein
MVALNNVYCTLQDLVMWVRWSFQTTLKKWASFITLRSIYF